MKISRRNGTGNVGPLGPLGGGAPRANRADSTSPAIGGSSELNVSISPRAAEVQQAQAALQSLPDTRVELVSALQSEIDSGTYQRDSHVIAKRMVNEALRESLRERQSRR
jgi:flagellar biosynthesis anti-sigma factor FlgM